MTARRASWPLVGPAVVIDAVTAPAVVVLLRDGLRRAERERWALSDETVAIVKALEALAATRRPAPSPADDPDVASGEWMSTADAAALLELSDRQVRRMAERGVLRSKKVGGRLLVDAADALAEADARAEWGTSADISGRPAEAA